MKTILLVFVVLLWSTLISAVASVKFQQRNQWITTLKNAGKKEDVWTCNAGWKRSRHKCFKTLKLNKETWKSAFNYCSEFGAFLALIDSRDTQAFLSQLIKPHAVDETKATFAWIGLSRGIIPTAKATVRSAVTASKLADYQWAMDTRTLNNYKSGFYNANGLNFTNFTPHKIDQLQWAPLEPSFGSDSCGALAVFPPSGKSLNRVKAFDGRVFDLPCSNENSTPQHHTTQPAHRIVAKKPIVEFAICETRASPVTAVDLQGSDIQGDLVVPAELPSGLADDSLQLDATSMRKEKVFEWIPEAYWTNGIVPYVISDAFSPTNSDQILSQLRSIEQDSNSCVKFVKRTNEADYIYFDKHHEAAVCASRGVGRQRGQQDIYLGQTCFLSTESAHIKHEVLHALGLPHEHQRYDRDEYVTIEEDNVFPITARSQFIKINIILPAWKNFPYDMESIMQYPEDAFAWVHGLITITAKQPKLRDQLRIVKHELSSMDKKKLKQLYCNRQQPLTPPSAPIQPFTPPPSTATRCEALDCIKNSNDGNCYGFATQRRTILDAGDACTRQCATLARVTKTNGDFINKLVDNQFPDNDTDCFNRITMLANYGDKSRSIKYGTYAFTMGSRCSTKHASGYEVCETAYDCTLVDWLRPSYSICVQPSAPPTTAVTPLEQQMMFNRDGFNNAWCMKKLSKELAPPGFEVFVTCKPISVANLDELNYFNPLCRTFYNGPDTTPTASQYGKQITRDFSLQAVRLFGAMYWPLDYNVGGCISKDGKSCSKAEFDGAPIYGMCRVETKLAEIKNQSEHYAQLWPDGRIPYTIVESFTKDDPSKATAIRGAINDIVMQSEACIKFDEFSTSTAIPFDHLEIVPHSDAKQCGDIYGSANAGRHTGIQRIYYGSNCFASVGNLYGPILYQLGISPEPFRFDRDQYLNVHGEDLGRGLYKPPIPGLLSLQTPYDYESVLHLLHLGQITSLNPTTDAVVQIVPKSGYKQFRVGQRTHLSEGDKQKLQLLYGKCLPGNDRSNSKEISPSTPCEPLDCMDNPDDGNCYAFVDQRRTMFGAQDACARQCATLARVTKTNHDFINKLVDKQFSDNDTDCFSRITMLANYGDRMRSKKYGTYAYTMGNHCRQPGDASGYEVCEVRYDCTLVDWLRRSYSICVRPSQMAAVTTQEQQLILNRDGFNDAWCMKKLSNDLAPPGFEVYVTCHPLPNAKELNELSYYSPLCRSFYSGTDTTPTAAQYGMQVTRDYKLNAVRLLGAIYWPLDYDLQGCITKNGNVCSKEEFTAAPIYGMCRIETKLAEFKSHSQQFAQLWPDGRVPFTFGDFYKDGVHNLFKKEKNALRSAMNDIVVQSRACIKFEEYNLTNVPFDHFELVTHIKPQQCGDVFTNANAGRQTGIQRLFFGDKCFEQVGNLYADILYQLGVSSEQFRFDRDDYLNVKGEDGNGQGWYKPSIPGLISLTTPYDYDSVVHMRHLWQDTTFNAPVAAGEVLIEPKNKEQRFELGQRTHLSEGDKQKLRLLYGECHSL